MRQNYNLFQTVILLAQALVNEWDDILQDTVATLIHSGHENMRAVIQAREGNTRFLYQFCHLYIIFL